MDTCKNSHSLTEQRDRSWKMLTYYSRSVSPMCCSQPQELIHLEPILLTQQLYPHLIPLFHDI